MSAGAIGRVVCANDEPKFYKSIVHPFYHYPCEPFWCTLTSTAQALEFQLSYASCLTSTGIEVGMAL